MFARTVRRILPLLAALFLVVPLLVGVSSAAAAYTTSDAVVHVMEGPQRNIGVDIDTRVYVPTTATSTTPQPALLMTHGFGLSKDSTEVTASADFFARHGYVVFTYTSQGFGKSGGCITLDAPDYDGVVASAMIDRLATMPQVKKDATGPVVGMLGGSYGGGITLIASQLDPRIRAIVPGRTWNSLQYALDPNNLTTGARYDHQSTNQGVLKFGWTSLFFASGNSQPAQGNGGCTTALQQQIAGGNVSPTDPNTPCLGYTIRLCNDYTQSAAAGNATPDTIAVLRESSWASYPKKRVVPTLLIQGQRDTLFTLNDALATYTRLRAKGQPVSMIWNWGGHGGYNSQPGEGEVYDGNTTHLDGQYLPERTLGWFDRYLRGQQGRQGPGFAWYDDASGTYKTAATYSVPSTRAFGLPASLGTFTNPPGGQPASYSETPNFSGPGSSPNLAGPPTDVPGEFVAWTSPKLTKPLLVVGTPQVTGLHVSRTPTGDVVFFAKLYDVAPDGSATLLRRLVAPVKIPAGRLANPVTFDLAGLAYRFAAGHQVRLVLASTDQSYANDRTPGAITVGGGRLVLPTR